MIEILAKLKVMPYWIDVILQFDSELPGGGGIPDAPNAEWHVRKNGEWGLATDVGFVQVLDAAFTTKTVGAGGDFADYAEAALWAQKHIGQALVLSLLSDIPATPGLLYKFNSFSALAIQSNGFSSPAAQYEPADNLVLLDEFRVTGTEKLRLFRLAIYDGAPANVQIFRVDSTEDVQIFSANIAEGFTIAVSGTARTQCFNSTIGGSGGGILTSGHLWLENTITGTATADDCSLHQGSVVTGAYKPTSALSPSINIDNGSSVGTFDYSLMPGSVAVFATWSGFVKVDGETDPAGKYTNLLQPPFMPNELTSNGAFCIGLWSV